MDRITRWQWRVLSLLALVVIAVPQASAQSARNPTEAESMPDPSWMHGVSGETQRAARKLFLAGNDLMDEQQYPAAVEQYQQALRLSAASSVSLQSRHRPDQSGQAHQCIPQLQKSAGSWVWWTLGEGKT